MTHREMKLNFPDCCPGEEYVQYIDWSEEFKIMEIHREKTTDPREWMFHVTDEPNEKTLRITYKPILPNTRNFDYFDINTENEECIKLLLTGSTLGPKLFCEKNNIIIKFPNQESVKKIIRIENSGTMDATFQFDIDNNVSDVKVSPPFGIVKKNEKMDLYVTCMAPKEPSFIFRQIFCLVLYQEPIIITFRANYKKESAFKGYDDFICFQETLPVYPNNYEAYLQDVATKLLLQSKPVVSLDRGLIDFGMLNPQRGLNSITESFTVTNHSFLKLLVHWIIDESNNFSIEPFEAEINGGSTSTFRAKFEPCHPDRMYQAKIIARVNWGADYEYVVPFQVSLDLMGHTFVGMRTGWDPFCQAGKRIILPPTLPNVPCYGSYKLKNTGHFPLMFKFTSPSVTNVTLKPDHGIIDEGKSQLFVLRLFPDIKADISYCEKWILEINMFKKLEVQITTTAQLPYLIISNKEIIEFPNTNIYSDTAMSVPIKNRTRLTLRLQLVINEPESPFYSENQEELIGPNQLRNVILHYHPQSYGEVKSHMFFNIVSENLPHTKTSIITTIKGACSNVTIHADPNYLCFEEILLKNRMYGTLNVINNSCCEAYIDLDLANPSSCNDLNVELIPKSFIIPAYSKIPIKVGVCPQSIDHWPVPIIYTLCTDKTLTSHTKVPPERLFSIDVHCSAPQLQVIDIRFSREYDNLAKYMLWIMMQINKLNEALKKLKFKPENKEIFLYMKLPNGGPKSMPLKVDLLMKNVSTHEARLDIEYIKKCNCKPVLEDVSMSIRRLKKKCRHEEQITFTFEKHIFKPKEEGIVTINTIFTEFSRKSYKFNISVSSVRDPSIKGTTCLFFEKICCKPGIKMFSFNYPTSFVTTVLVDAFPVYVGDPCKPMQIIWTYNNFNQEIPYKIKTDETDQLQIFEFPQTSGSIAPYSAHPLAYKFTPYQFKTYKKIYSIVTPDVTYTLEMTGEGMSYPCYKTYSMVIKAPLMSLFPANSEDIELSAQHLLLKPMLIHSVVRRMIFIKNNTDENVQFSWTERRFGAMFCVAAIPGNGILKSKQLRPCQIVVRSLSMPARFTAFITCKIVHIDKMNEYLSKVDEVRKVAKAFDSCFAINSSGYAPITMKVEGAVKPTPTFYNLTISLHSLSEKHLDAVIPIKKEQLRALAQTKADLTKMPFSLLTRTEGDMCISALRKVIWEILNRKIFLNSVSKPKEITYYKDIAEEEHIEPYVETPNNIIIDVLSTEIFKGLLGIFAITDWLDDTDRRSKQEEDEEKSCALINNYYSDIVGHGNYNVVSMVNHGTISFGKKFSDINNLKRHIKFLANSMFQQKHD